MPTPDGNVARWLNLGDGMSVGGISYLNLGDTCPAGSDTQTSDVSVADLSGGAVAAAAKCAPISGGSVARWGKLGDIALWTSLGEWMPGDTALAWGGTMEDTRPDGSMPTPGGSVARCWMLGGCVARCGLGDCSATGSRGARRDATNTAPCGTTIVAGVCTADAVTVGTDCKTHTTLLPCGMGGE